MAGSPSEESLSTTSYAILGYLAVRPWTAYELTKQLGRSFHHFWPRAESGIYREFKRLTAAGLAVATEERTGARARSRYELTDAGRTALDAWLAEPRSDGFLETEGLVRILFADRRSTDDARALLDAMTADAGATAAQMVELMEGYLTTGGDFPERAHVNVLIARFLVDFAAMVEQWARWSGTVIDDWPTRRDGRPAADDERIRTHIQSTIEAGRAIGSGR
jgi:DNA-binding PadR family transcriptional regulator